MNEDTRASFLTLSETLTGVRGDSVNVSPPAGEKPRAKPGDLAPHNTPIDLVTLYVETVQANGYGKVLDDLIKAFPAQGSKQERDAFVSQCLSDPTSARGYLCRNLIKLWYLGIWYPPASIGGKDERAGWKRWAGLPREVVSMQAYKEALVWKIMRAHPMAYSMSPFGYWADDPPPLDRFVTVL